MEHEALPPRKGPRRALWIGWMSMMYVLDRFVDVIGENVGLMRREYEVFIGSGLLLVGLLSFESDKFCDGNTADYLSCTRPSTYYYFDALDITLIILGVFFLLAWYLKRQRA